MGKLIIYGHFLLVPVPLENKPERDSVVPARNDPSLLTLYFRFLVLIVFAHEERKHIEVQPK